MRVVTTTVKHANNGMEPIYEQVEDCEEPRGGRTGERHVHDKLNAKDSNETCALICVSQAYGCHG